MEYEYGSDNNDDALDGIRDSVSDGMNGVKGLESNFLVQVEEQARNEKTRNKLGSGDDSSGTNCGLFPSRYKLRRVVDD